MADRERGERIKALRKAKAQREGHKVTQPQMAEAVGVTLRAAQEWEYGGGVDDEHLTALLTFLETNADYLLRGVEQPGETPDPFASGDPYAAQLNRIEKGVDEILKRLSDETRP